MVMCRSAGSAAAPEGQRTPINGAGNVASIRAWSPDNIATDRLPRPNKRGGNSSLRGDAGSCRHWMKQAFDAYRRSRAFQKWKHRMWDEGVKMPTQLASGKSKCFCGAEIDLTNTEQHIYSAHMDLK